MQRRDFFKGAMATMTCAAAGGQPLLAQQASGVGPLAHDSAAPRPPDDPWPGKKKVLAIADPEEWYSSAGYHHDSAYHTLATVERLGRESGAWITIIRTDMR